MYTEITSCRICGNRALVPVLDLGWQHLTGVFPGSPNQPITAGPLELVKCEEDGTGSTCGLLQLRHSYEATEMYGQSYGYRSGINHTMTSHLQNKVARILGTVDLAPGDLVIDIGSNDGTLLKNYSPDLTLIGVDPSGAKFQKYYPDHIRLITDFFRARLLKAQIGAAKAKVITSIAMFYDLEDPIAFMTDVSQVLADDGIWVLEQSYMPEMLQQNAYDTICQEHLEYYGLRQIKWMTDRVGLKILDVELNRINGGSFSITVAKADSPYSTNEDQVNGILQGEDTCGLSESEIYSQFAGRVFQHRDQLRKVVHGANQHGEAILGYGASTKGNVILQFCDLSSDDVPAIADRNPEKHGRYTPGTHIPIISEAEARSSNPDYLLALPWHFREEFMMREQNYLRGGGRFLFPLPAVALATCSTPLAGSGSVTKDRPRLLRSGLRRRALPV